MGASAAHTGQKTICFDLDGVICTQRDGGDYENAEPVWDVIERIRDLHADGCRVLIWTARGSESGIDWRSVTESQLVRWRVPYHSLRFGKPFAHVYVDDRAVNVRDW